MGWTTRRWTWVASIHGLGSETTVWVGPHGDGHELGLSTGWVQRPRYGLDHMGWTWVASIHGLGTETTVWVGPRGDGHGLGPSMGWVQRQRYGLDHTEIDMGCVHPWVGYRDNGIWVGSNDYMRRGLLARLCLRFGFADHCARLEIILFKLLLCISCREH